MWVNRDVLRHEIMKLLFRIKYCSKCEGMLEGFGSDAKGVPVASDHGSRCSQRLVHIFAT